MKARLKVSRAYTGCLSALCVVERDYNSHVCKCVHTNFMSAVLLFLPDLSFTNYHKFTFDSAINNLFIINLINLVYPWSGQHSLRMQARDSKRDREHWKNTAFKKL